jgi:molybdate/tungstate transport system permease protein
MTKTRPDFFSLSLIFLGGLVLLFIVAPIAGMFIRTPAGGIFENIADKEVQDSIFLTLATAMSATLAFGLLAIPFAYILARKKFIFKRLVLGIINLPVVIPHSAAGIAILGFISRDSLVGRAAGSMGIDLVGNHIGISIAMAFVSLPFLINAAIDGFIAVPEKYEKAAMNLGASPARVFFSISLPLAWRNILSGLILMFARGMSEFGAIVIVAYHPMVTPVLIFERFGAFGLKYAQPVAVIFITVSLIFFILLRLFVKDRKDA